MGRSTWETAEDRRREIERMAGLGLSHKQIGDEVGVSRQHVWRVLKQGETAKTVRPLDAMTADEVRQARAVLGYSQMQMAAALGGVHANSVAAWETGRRKIKPHTAVAIRLLLGQASKPRRDSKRPRSGVQPGPSLR